jgi:hypothetical protein
VPIQGAADTLDEAQQALNVAKLIAAGRRKRSARLRTRQADAVGTAWNKAS